MKKIITYNELREKMNSAIELLCDTVKTTLGPKGSNAIIDHSSFTPFITNDGVTIAKNIESDDEIVNTILELAKESSINTDNNVGDGTTTTLVLLESIYKNCLKIIDEGESPILLKKEIDSSLNEIIKMIKNYNRLPNNKELLNIANISANSELIGKTIYEAYQKVKDKNAIIITEDKTNEIIHKKGYIIETLLASPYFMLNKDVYSLDSVKTIIVNNCINDIEEIASLINELLITKEIFIIFAHDYSDSFISQILAINNQENLNIILLKIPGYGENKLNIMNDLALISECSVTNNLENILKDNIGHISKINIYKKETIISFKMNSQIQKEINNLENNLNNINDVLKEENQKRLAMFKNGLIEIKITAPSEVELREMKMRYIDALWAIDIASKGVVTGSGLIFYKIAEELENTKVLKIFKEALKEPFKQIMINAGLDSEKIIKYIKDNEYQKVYNINKEKYEDIAKTEVLDPTEVLINSLVNATSVATMLITTNTLIINEYKNELGKKSEFLEI